MKDDISMYQGEKNVIHIHMYKSTGFIKPCALESYNLNVEKNH